MNNSSGRVSVWARFADGSFNYQKLGSFPSPFQDVEDFSFVADAWVYDPFNSCTSLILNQVAPH